MSRISRAIAGGFLAVLLGSSAATGAVAPEPDAVPTDWQFDVEVDDLRVVTIGVPGEGPRHFYYLTYQVVNETGEDLFFAPMFELATDQGEVFLSGRSVPSAVTRELLARLQDPLLEDQLRILGTIRQGEENAKDGLVIWPVGSTTVDSVNVYCMGFSGENKTITVRDAETGDPKPVVLRKTLMLRHRVPGDLITPKSFSAGGRELPRYQTRWILRKAETTIDPSRGRNAVASERARDETVSGN